MPSIRRLRCSVYRVVRPITGLPANRNFATEWLGGRHLHDVLALASLVCARSHGSRSEAERLFFKDFERTFEMLCGLASEPADGT